MSNQTWVTLKNDEKLSLRNILVTDIQERHEFFVKLSLAQMGVVHTIDEIEIHTYETHDKINDFINNKRGLWLVAVTLEKKIVGEIDITVKNLIRIRHNGFLSLGILPAFQGLGLGTHMMEHALMWAKERNLLRIELSVFNSNIKAQSLYKKFGFMVEGVRKSYLRHEHGVFEDDLMMAKYL
jgi:ribosomal protein S18 acetylase RimI-like enzyme